MDQVRLKQACSAMKGESLEILDITPIDNFKLT